MKKSLITAVVTVALATISAAPVVASQHDLTDGQVTKIDEPTERITLRHSPIKSLDMDAMTMLFRVKDKAMLKAVKVGDKVKFRAERVDGRITLTHIEKTK